MVRIKEVKEIEIKEQPPDNFIIIVTSQEGDDIMLDDAILKETPLDRKSIDEESLNDEGKEHGE